MGLCFPGNFSEWIRRVAPNKYSDESNIATIRISEAIQKNLNALRPTAANLIWPEVEDNAFTRNRRDQGLHI
jgi:hypothetical protein